MATAANRNKWLGYILYVVLVTLALLYYLFPGQEVEDLIDQSVSRINPALGFQAKKITPWVVPGLRLSEGRIYLNNNADATVFKTESLNIRPQIFKLLGGKYNVKFSGAAYKGDINGYLNLEDENGDVFASELIFEDIDLADYGFLADKLQHKLTGMFSGNIVYAKDSPAAAGNGKADLKLSNGLLQFINPIFGIDSVDLQSIDLELEIRNSKLTIIKGELAGSELKAALAGSIQLQPDLKNSPLNLKGTMEPLPEFYRKYPDFRELLKSMNKRVKRGQYFFALTGTLGEPRFRLL